MDAHSLIRDHGMTRVGARGGFHRLFYQGVIYGPSFASDKAAEKFVEFVAGRTGLDPYHQSEDSLDGLYQLWRLDNAA